MGFVTAVAVNHSTGSEVEVDSGVQGIEIAFERLAIAVYIAVLSEVFEVHPAWPIVIAEARCEGTNGVGIIAVSVGLGIGEIRIKGPLAGI